MADNITVIAGDINSTISGSLNSAISGSLNINGSYPSLNSGVYPAFDNINQTVVLNQTYLTGQFGATPMPVFLLMAAGAIALLILAFYLPLRNEMGGINVAKTGLSFVGAVFNIITALSSFVISEDNGSSIATYGTYTVNVISHTLWQSPYTTAIFVVSSILCFVMFVYSVMQPDIILKPDKNEYKNNSIKDGERK